MKSVLSLVIQVAMRTEFSLILAHHHGVRQRRRSLSGNIEITIHILVNFLPVTVNFVGFRLIRITALFSVEVHHFTFVERLDMTVAPINDFSQVFSGFVVFRVVQAFAQHVHYSGADFDRFVHDKMDDVFFTRRRSHRSSVLVIVEWRWRGIHLVIIIKQVHDIEVRKEEIVDLFGVHIRDTHDVPITD
jgi:hypothetical protein